MKTSIIAIVFFCASSILASTALAVHGDLVQCLESHSDPAYPISSLIYTPQNSSFPSVLQTYIRNLRFNESSTPKPLLIITAFHVSHIRAAIFCGQAVGVQLKTRSGGHDYEGVSYWSETPFFMLDMFNMRSIDVNVSDNTAWVQVGATLGEVFYGVFNATNGTRGFPAGVCPTVGVGGHFSGAGYGNMLRKYGLSVDNIVDAQIITVNGTLLDRKSMGEDLFWAITGGGGIDFNARTGNLNGMMGTYGTYEGATVVTSVSFTTSNYRTYGPFGSKIGTHFNYKVNDGEVIAGFHGRAGSLIDAIGLYTRSTDLSKNGVFVGPIGSEGGIKWAYRPKGLITRISINHTNRMIYAIHFESKDEQGNVDRSPIYGKEYLHGTNFEIDINSEVGKLNGIMGTINAQYNKDPVIGSLCFSTDKKIVFGPFGNPNKGTHFSIPLKDGYISGIHGASVGNNELYFHSIGVYVNP